MVLHPFRTLSLVLGSHFPFPGQIGSYFGKFSCKFIKKSSQWFAELFLSVYQKYGSTCLGSIVFSNAIPTFWLSDADAIKVVSTDRTVFQKDVEAVCRPLHSTGTILILHVVRNPQHLWSKSRRDGRFGLETPQKDRESCLQ